MPTSYYIYFGLGVLVWTSIVMILSFRWGRASTELRHQDDLTRAFRKGQVSITKTRVPDL